MAVRYETLVFEDIPKISSVDSFYLKYLYFPVIQTPRQREWEFLVTKLHGADLAASDEDMETIRNLVKKLGR